MTTIHLKMGVQPTPETSCNELYNGQCST